MTNTLARFAYAAVLLAASARAHSRVWGAWINGQDQGNGQGKFIRTPPNDSPIMDLSLPELNCNFGGDKPAPGFLAVSAGDTITVEWYWANRGDMIIGKEHRGPVITYITPYVDGQPTGPVWTKIHQDGFDPATQTFGVDNLIANKGKMDVKLPLLADGKYLLRQEIIALHGAGTSYIENPQWGAQLYPECLQIEVTGGKGNLVPDQNFDLNKGYTYDHPGLKFQLWVDHIPSYTVPGPEVWQGSAGGGNGGSNGTEGTPMNESPGGGCGAALPMGTSSQNQIQTGSATGSATDSAMGSAEGKPTGTYYTYNY